MRRLKWWHWILLALVVLGMLGGTLVLLLFAPGIQRRLFLSAVEAPGRTVEVNRLSAGLGGVDIDGLTWTEGDRRFAVREVRLKMPLLDAALHNRVAIEELAVHGLSADLGRGGEAAPGRSSEPSESAREGEPADGRKLQIPLDLSLQRVAIDGEVILPGAGPDRARATFALEGGGFARGSEARFSLRGHVEDPGTAALKAGADLSGELKVRQSAQAEIEASELTLQTPWLSGTLATTSPAGSLREAVAEAKFRGDLAHLITLVPAAVRPPVATGTFELSVRVSEAGGDKHQAVVRLEARQLAGETPEGRVELAGLGLDLTAAGPAAGPVDVQASVTVAGTRTDDVSDIRAQGTINPGGESISATLDVASRRLSLPGVQKLAALLTPPTESEGPPWAGLEGEIRLALQQVELNPDTAARDVHGTVHIAAAGVSIDGLQGDFMDAPFDGKTSVTYDADKRTYGLTGAFGFSALDVGKALKAMQPDRPPDLEGVFAARASVEGTAPDLPGLATAIRGELTLHGTQGVFRGLRQKTGGSLSAAAGLIGALTRNKTALTIADIASMLEAVPYDEMTVDAKLGEGDVLQVRSVALRAPELALSGSGSLTLARGGSWIDWLKAPMALELNLGGKGRLGQWLTQFGVAAPQADAAGFVSLKKPFKLGGSASAVDSSDLWATLARAATNAASQLLQPSSPKPAPDSAATPPDKAP